MLDPLDRDFLRVSHMVVAARQIISIVAATSVDELRNDALRSLGILHLLQIVGEAATKLSSEFVSRTPEIPWQKVRTFRHRVVHDYFQVNYTLVWHIVEKELPTMLIVLRKQLPAEPPDIRF